jgi:3-oxoadipate enol-lactonase
VTDLAHRVDGPDGAPAVVLSNSLGTDMRMWDPQLAALTRRFRVVRYDTRGHGGSPVPQAEQTIAGLAEDLLGLLDHLGLARASVAGVSLGGMTAMQLASTAPERVDRLVLCATSARLGPPEMWRERADTVRAEGMAALADATLRRWFTPAADPAIVARFEAMFRAIPADGYAACCAAVRDMDLRGRLPDVAAPALVLVGRDDPATPPDHAELIAAAIPGARLTTIERGAHLVNVERADEVTAAMLEHLER